jgi:AhpD family alkylhydroperoxidase
VFEDRRKRAGGERTSIESELKIIETEGRRLTEAIKKGGKLDILVTEAKAIDRRHKDAKRRYQEALAREQGDDGPATPQDLAIDPRKALIELAVVAQIPCQYCIWADTCAAKAAGATDEETAEAIAVAATGRYWSSMLNGLEIDFDTFKAEFDTILGLESGTE